MAEYDENEVSAAETSDELAADLLTEARKLTREHKIVSYVLVCIDEDDEVHSMTQGLATVAETAMLKALLVAGQDMCEMLEDDGIEDLDS